MPSATEVFTLSATPVAWVSAALLWTCAGWFLIRMRAPNARAGIGQNTSDAGGWP
jgi:hypothetical protein